MAYKPLFAQPTTATTKQTTPKKSGYVPLFAGVKTPLQQAQELGKTLMTPNVPNAQKIEPVKAPTFTQPIPSGQMSPNLPAPPKPSAFSLTPTTTAFAPVGFEKRTTTIQAPENLTPMKPTMDLSFTGFMNELVKTSEPIAKNKTFQKALEVGYNTYFKPENVAPEGALAMKVIEKGSQPALERVSQIPVVKKSLETIGRETGGLSIASRIQSIMPDKTYKEAYDIWTQKSQDPNSPVWKKFFYQTAETLPQSALGVVMSFVPYVGKPLSYSYWSAISANEQLQKTGKVSSITNIGIDVIGDSLLGNSIEGLLKLESNTLKKTVINGFGVEGGTEVAQDLLKFQNNYTQAKTKEEKNMVLNEAKDYFKSGQVLMTLGVGGISGGVISGGSYMLGGDVKQNQVNVPTITFEDWQKDQKLIDDNNFKIQGLPPESQKAFLDRQRGIVIDELDNAITLASKKVSTSNKPSQGGFNMSLYGELEDLKTKIENKTDTQADILKGLEVMQLLGMDVNADVENFKIDKPQGYQPLFAKPETKSNATLSEMAKQPVEAFKIQNVSDKQFYHGTKQSFDKFITEKYGEGAGGDLWGTGVYLTDSEEIAKGYAGEDGVILTPKIEGELNLFEPHNKEDFSEFIKKFANDLKLKSTNEYEKQYADFLIKNSNKGFDFFAKDYWVNKKQNKYSTSDDKIEAEKKFITYLQARINDTIIYHKGLQPGERIRLIDSDFSDYIKSKGYDGIKYEAGRVSNVPTPKGAYNYVIYSPEKIIIKKQKDTLFKVSPTTEYNKKTEDATNFLNKMFGDKVLFQTATKITTPNGYNAVGRSVGNLIELVENNGKITDSVLYHEAFHTFLNTFIKSDKRQAIINYVKNNYSQELGAYKEYTSQDKKAEEFIADKFAEFVKNKETKYTGIKGFFQKVLDALKNIISNKNEFNQLFETALKTGENVKEDNINNVISFIKKWTAYDNIININNANLSTYDRLKNYITPEIYKELSKYKPTEPITLYRFQRKGTKTPILSSWSKDKEWVSDMAELPDMEFIEKTFYPYEILVDIEKIPSKTELTDIGEVIVKAKNYRNVSPIRSKSLLSQLSNYKIDYPTNPDEFPAELTEQWSEEEILKAQQDALKEELATIDWSFTNGEMENGYQNFVKLLKDKRTSFIKERMLNGDIGNFKDALVKANIFNSPAEVTANFFSGYRDETSGQEYSDDELLDIFKDRVLKEYPALFAGKKVASNLGLFPSRETTQEVRNNVKPIQELSKTNRDRMISFFKPSTQKVSRAFSLLGNKHTTIGIFKEIFNNWVKSGVKQIIEPYGGAFTLGTHSIDEAIKSGLKQFDSNIFDQEKYVILKAIQDGNLEQVKKQVDASLLKLTNDLRNEAKTKNKELFDLLEGFINKHPNSFIGSKDFFLYAKDTKTGKDVTNLPYLQTQFAKTVQGVFNNLIKVEPNTLSSAIQVAIIKRIAVYSGKSQPLILQGGFRSIEEDIFGKYGMVKGFEDVQTVFDLAKDRGTIINIHNMDGAEFIKQMANENKFSPQEIGIYFDPPYVKSAAVYKDQQEYNNLEKFSTGEKFVQSHKPAFDLENSGARMALTNDIEDGYLNNVIGQMKNKPAEFFAYREGKTPTSLIVSNDTMPTMKEYVSRKEIRFITNSLPPELLKINAIIKERDLRMVDVYTIKHMFGIDNMRLADKEKLEQVFGELQKMQPSDRFLTPRQRDSFKEFLTAFDKDSRLVTQRELQTKFKETDDIKKGFFDPLFTPTVNIKEGHPIITFIVDKADNLMRLATKNTTKRYKDIVDIYRKTLKQDGTKLSTLNQKIFSHMSGSDVKLTENEQLVSNELNAIYDYYKEKLQLEKWRIDYIPNIEKSFYEKFVANKFNLTETIKSYVNGKKEDSLPIDLLMALPYIIGSKKFFKFALERKGGIDPSFDILKITKTYIEMAENKIALDQILPEAQTSFQLLLQPKSALWLKSFIQNLKGRPLDVDFRRNHPFVVKAINGLVDIGYIKSLGVNWKSALKNIVAGETNTFIYQSVSNYLTGKARIISSPKKAYNIISNSGLLDGSYVDTLEVQAIKGKVKKFLDTVAFGAMQAGEYEIRGSFMLGEMTDLEWKHGELGVTGETADGNPIIDTNLAIKRFRGILDNIAKIQGLYTRIDTPLQLQTTIGRTAFQFGRWKITNIQLTRNLTADTVKEIRSGKIGHEATIRVLKMIILIGLWSLLAYKFAEKGYKNASRIFQAGTELINLFINPIQQLYGVLAENPLLNTMAEIAFSMNEIIGLISGNKPSAISFENGIESTYVAGLETLKDLGIMEREVKSTGGGSNKPAGLKPTKPSKPKKPAKPKP